MASLKAYGNNFFISGISGVKNKLLVIIASRSKSGFTLIEVAVVMGLFVIIGSLGLAMSMESYRGNAIREERDLIVSALQTARSQAINNICVSTASSCTDGKPHGVHINPGSYIIYQYQPGATTANAFSGRDAAFDREIKSDYRPITLNGPNNDVIFEKLSGNAAKKRNIIITDSAHQSVTITISDQGQIDWTSVTH